MTVLTAGGVLYLPKQGETSVTPIAALFLMRDWGASRTRNVVSIFVDDMEYDRSFDNLKTPVCR